MEILLLIIAIALGFFLQSIAGFSASLVSIPILLYAFPMQDTIAIMSIYFLIFSLVMITQHRKHINKEVVKELIFAATIGLAIGITLLKYSDPEILRIILGVLIMGYAVFAVIKPSIKVNKKAGPIWGFIAGTVSGLYTAGAPIYVSYINSRLNRKKVIKSTIIGTLAITNFLRIPLLMYNQMITYDIMIKVLYALPFFALAVIIGHYAYKKMDEKIFRYVILGLIFLSGASLLFR